MKVIFINRQKTNKFDFLRSSVNAQCCDEYQFDNPQMKCHKLLKMHPFINSNLRHHKTRSPGENCDAILTLRFNPEMHTMEQ